MIITHVKRNNFTITYRPPLLLLPPRLIVSNGENYLKKPNSLSFRAKKNTEKVISKMSTIHETLLDKLFNVRLRIVGNVKAKR